MAMAGDSQWLFRDYIHVIYSTGTALYNTLPRSKSFIWSICPQSQTKMSLSNTYHANDSEYILGCHCNTEHQLCRSTFALLLRHVQQSGCNNEDIAEQYEQTRQQSQRRVNEAAEVTLSSMLLIAVSEERVETRTSDRFSLGLLQ